MSIRILADSTCDLSKDLLDRFGVKIVPLSIIMGDKSYYDGEETTPDQIFEWSDANKTTPKTAAVSQERATEALTPII